MNIQPLRRGLDHTQQRHPWLAFPIAVVRKAGEDNVGNLGAVLAWNAFVSIFPLLLVLVTVLSVALRASPSLQQQVVHSALADFPVIGSQLQANIHSLNRTGLALGIGLAGTFYGARGVADAAQNALNTVWEVPYVRRPSFASGLLRDLGLVVSFGLGMLVTGALSGYGAGVSTVPTALRIVVIVMSFVLNVGLFWMPSGLRQSPRSRHVTCGSPPFSPPLVGRHSSSLPAISSRPSWGTPIRCTGSSPSCSALPPGCTCSRRSPCTQSK